MAIGHFMEIRAQRHLITSTTTDRVSGMNRDFDKHVSTRNSLLSTVQEGYNRISCIIRPLRNIVLNTYFAKFTVKINISRCH